MMWLTNAQTSLLTEGFDNNALPNGWTTIDADGDGNNWDPSFLFGIAEQSHSGAGMIASASYINLPDGSGGQSVTPDNWLISPAITIGDNLVMLSFWVAAQDPTFCEEKYGVYVSTTGTEVSDFTQIFEGYPTGEWSNIILNLSAYANQTIHFAFRHFDCTDQYWLKIDDVELSTANGSFMVTNLDELDFGALQINETSTNAVNVTGFGLTGNITATAPTPYLVSTDDVTYASTATLPANGGLLYIKFAPTVSGTFNDEVVLSAADAPSTNISLFGSAIDCNTFVTFPFTEEFEDGMIPQCWTTNDADGDDFTWMVFYLEEDPEAHTGHGMAASFSFQPALGMALTPDDWLITPPIHVGSNPIQLDYFVAAQDAEFSNENYGIYVSTTGTDQDDFTSVFESVSPADWQQETIILGDEYLNQTIYIAFRHYNSTDQLAIRLDDVSISEVVGIEDCDDTNINVYPNPATNMININANDNIENIAIYDLAGAQVGFYFGNGNNTQINVSNLADGLYFLKIKTDNGMITKKINVVK